MSFSAEILTEQLKSSTYVTKKNIAGLTHEESVLQPKPGGNCLNWVLGHIVYGRNLILAAMGEKSIWDEAPSKRYERGSPPITDPVDALPLEKMAADLSATEEKILAALPKLTPEQLAAKAPFSPGGGEEETVGTLLPILVFHDIYHAGQTGTIRRLAGKDGALR